MDARSPAPGQVVAVESYGRGPLSPTFQAAGAPPIARDAPRGATESISYDAQGRPIAWTHEGSGAGRCALAHIAPAFTPPQLVWSRPDRAPSSRANRPLLACEAAVVAWRGGNTRLEGVRLDSGTILFAWNATGRPGRGVLTRRAFIAEIDSGANGFELAPSHAASFATAPSFRRELDLPRGCARCFSIDETTADLHVDRALDVALPADFADQDGPGLLEWGPAHAIALGPFPYGYVQCMSRGVRFNAFVLADRAIVQRFSLEHEGLSEHVIVDLATGACTHRAPGRVLMADASGHAIVRSNGTIVMSDPFGGELGTLGRVTIHGMTDSVVLATATRDVAGHRVLHPILLERRSLKCIGTWPGGRVSIVAGDLAYCWGNVDGAALIDAYDVRRAKLVYTIRLDETLAAAGITGSPKALELVPVPSGFVVRCDDDALHAFRA